MKLNAFSRIWIIHIYADHVEGHDEGVTDGITHERNKRMSEIGDVKVVVG